MSTNEPPSGSKPESKTSVVTEPDKSGTSVSQTIEIPEPALQAILKVANKFHHGPIPDAESFEKYEKSLAGAGDRILKMAEADQALRIQQTPINQKREFIGRITGQAAGTASFLSVIGAATYIAVTAQSAGAMVVASAMVAGPVLLCVEKITNFFRKN